MKELSQNKKIALSCLVVFLVSFIAMYSFLSDNHKEVHGKVNVLHVEKNHGNIPYEEFKDDKKAIFVTNAEGTIQYTNESFCNLIIFDCDQSIGKNIFDLIRVEEHSEVIAAYTKIIQDAKEFEAVGPVIIGEGKFEKLVLLSGKPVVGKEKKVQEIIFSFKDLTDQVKGLQ